MTLYQGSFSVRITRVFAGVLAAFLVFSAVAPATAQESDAGKILKLISSANDKYKSEDYTGALVDYEAAYELYPDSSLLYRLGLTSEKLEKSFDAISYYEKFIDAVPDDKTAKKVRERLENLKATAPGRVVVESTPAGASIFLNSAEGTPVGTTPAAVDIDAGDVVVYVVLEGYQTEVHQMTIENAKVVPLTVEMKENLVAETPDPEEPSSSGSGLGTWGWVATGTGVALLAGGGAFSFLSMQAEDDVNTYDKRATGASPTELQEFKDSADSHYTTSLIFYAAGGVLTATGITLLILDGMGTESESAIRMDVAPTQGGAQVGFSGSF